MCWRVGLGDQILVASDPWIPDNAHFKLFDSGVNMQYLKVTDLTADDRTWKKEVTETNFSEADARNILQIPLATEGYADFMV